MLPFMLNVKAGGKTWLELGIRKSQVLAAHGFIADEFPQIHAWIVENVEMAVSKGWLDDA